MSKSKVRAKEFAQHNAEAISDSVSGCGLVALSVESLQGWLETAYRAGELRATDLEDLEEKERRLKSDRQTE